MEEAMTLEDTVRGWPGPVSDFISRYYRDLYDPKYRFPVGKVPASPWKPGDMIQEGPGKIQDLMQLMEDKFKQYGLCHDNPGNFAYMPNGACYTGCLGEYLRGALDLTQTEEELRQVLVRWLCSSLVGYSSTADGLLTPGGTPSTTVAVAAARNAVDVEPQDYHRLVVYTTRLIHFCLERALHVVGLGQCVLRTVKHTDQTMCTDELEKQIILDQQAGLLPFMVAGSFGTCETGSIDPFHKMAAVADKYDLWLHVDACYGGFYLLTDSVRQLDAVSGLSRADSIILDAHKAFFHPRGTSFILFRSGLPEDLTDTVNGVVRGPMEDVSTPRCFPLWFSLNAMGLNTSKRMAERNLKLAQYLYDQLDATAGIHVLMRPHLTVMPFRCAGSSPGMANSRTRQLVEFLREDGRVNVLSATIDGYIYLRIAIPSSRIGIGSINLLVDLIRTLMHDLFGERTTQSSNNNAARQIELLEVENAFKAAERETMGQLSTHLLQLPTQHSTREAPKEERQSYSIPENPVPMKQLIEMCETMKRSDTHLATYTASIGQLMGSIFNFHPCHNIAAPDAITFEEDLVRWFAGAAGLSGAYQGALCGDNQSANTVCFLSARHSYITNPHNYQKYAMYMKEKDVYHFKKSLNLVGMHNCPVQILPCADDDYTLDTEQLQRQFSQMEETTPMMVALRITCPEEFEQLAEIVPLAQRNGVWVHVDSILALAHNITGLDGVDSAALDLSQCLQQPTGTSLLLVRDVTTLKRSLSPRMHTWVPSALPTSYKPTEFLLESTRPCRGLPVLFTLKTLGSKRVLNMLKAATW